MISLIEKDAADLKLTGTYEFKKKEEQIRDTKVTGMKKPKFREKIIFSNQFSLSAVIDKVLLFKLKKRRIDEI